MAWSLFIWLAALALESVPLVRAVAKRFIDRYKFFYAYLGLVLLRDLVLLTVYFVRGSLYPYAYWGSEPLVVLAGCGVVWEIYRIALAPYPGAARVARNVLAFLFIFTIARVFVRAWTSPNWIPGMTLFSMERDLRIVQGALLLGLILLIAYYSIPLGRNLKGIVWGYALVLFANVVNLTLRNDLGESFQRVWAYIEPGSYLFALAVWCAMLWSYAPTSHPGQEPRLELDYQALLKATREALSSARAQVLKGMHL